MTKRTTPHLAIATMLVLFVAAALWLLVDANGPARTGDAPMGGAAAATPAPHTAAAGDHGDGGATRIEVAVDPTARSEWVHGRVLDAGGRPLAGALVGRVGDAEPARTAADGRFALAPSASPGDTLLLLILAADHAPLVTEHILPRGAEADVGDLRLLDGGAIHGRITDTAGAALGSATVTLQPLAGSWPHALDRELLARRAATTADGRYSFPALVPGAYRVAASAPDHQTGQSERAVQVADGEDVDVEPIALARGYAVRGRVVDMADAPLADVEVRARQRARGVSYRGEATTTDDGRFELTGVPPGPLELDVTRAGFLPFHRSDVDPTTGGELVVRLTPGLAIRGVAVDARTGAPVERFAASIRRVGQVDPSSNGAMAQQLGRRLTALRDAAARTEDAAHRALQTKLATELQARLDRLERSARAWPAAEPPDLGPLEAHPEGEWAFEGLEEGLYEIGIGSPDHCFARAGPIELRSGVPVSPVRVELRAGHAVRGAVVAAADGRPIADATVELRHPLPPSEEPDGHKRSLYPWMFGENGRLGVTLQTTRTGTDGGFVFPQAAPGPAFVVVRSAAIADHESDVFQVPLGERRLRIEVGGRARLTGRVQGVPAGREDGVTILVLGGHGTLRTEAARRDGSYAIDGLQPGSYLVRAFAADDDRYVDRLFGALFPLHAGAVDPEAIPPRDVELRAGETRAFDVTLDVPATGAVEGVATVNGRPSERIVVLLRPQPGAAPGSGGLSVRAQCDADGRFRLDDVPAGEYGLEIYGPTAQRLHEQSVAVAPGAVVHVALALEAGGLRGTVTAPDGADPSELRGSLWLLPGAAEAPADPYAWRREHRTHRLRIHDGRFEDDALTPGPAIAILDIRGRPRVSAPTVICAGATVDLELTAAPRAR